MVAQTKIMRWPPWPPIPSKRFEVVVVIHRLEDLDSSRFYAENDDSRSRKLVVGIKWKGQKTVRLRRSVAKNFTKESGGCGGDGVVEWNDEFKRICRFSSYREGLFLPWEVAFTVFNGITSGSKEDAPVLGTALLNIAELISLNRQEDVQIKVPLTIPGSAVESTLSLLLSLRFTAKESSSERQKPVRPVSSSPCSSDFSSEDKTGSSVKTGLRKIKTFRKCISLRGTKKQDRVDESSSGCDQNRNQDDESNYPVDTDSLDDEAEGESEESRDEIMPYSSWVMGSYNFQTSPEDEYVIYYSHRRSDAGRFTEETSYESEGSGQSSRERLKKKKLSWRKRKLSFRSPKPKGEPLLKKDCSESGGDDIDFVRRQLCPSDESVSEWCSYKSEGSVSVTKHLSGFEFGEDNFIVGSWESKEISSRGGSMILKAQIFFASIDQRSDLAAGENACTALVAVIADWLQNNIYIMPTRSEFDSLIKDGSLEWRNLFENQEYHNRFPDGHFVLETVLQSKIRPICAVPEKSFVGFFHPDETDLEGKEEASFQFLHGVMSFDSIWEEISKQETTDSPVIYVVSWNDHFFVLLINRDVYYIIDTLGERLYEGCNQAFVLKFEKDTVITGSSNGEHEEKYVVCCGGKESCKTYIKSFLAAIPVRQLKEDLRKGLVSTVHRPLQIEFHYTEPFLSPGVKTLEKEEEEEEGEALVDNGGSAEAVSMVAARKQFR